MTKLTTRKNIWLIPISLLLAAVIIFFAIYLSSASNRSEKSTQLSLVNSSTQRAASSLDMLTWTIVTIRRGDTLIKILNRLKIPHAKLQNILKISAGQHLINLRAHQKIAFELNAKHDIVSIKYPINHKKTLILMHDQNNFVNRVERKPTMSNLLLYKSAIIH